MKLVEALMNSFGLETREQKANRIAFERYKKANYNFAYSMALNFVRDYELTVNNLLLNDEQLKPKVLKALNGAIKSGTIHRETYEMCNPMEIL